MTKNLLHVVRSRRAQTWLSVSGMNCRQRVGHSCWRDVPRRLAVAITVLVMLILLPAPVSGQVDVFMLANGGRIEGKWLNRESESPVSYEIALSDGGQLTLASDQVQEIMNKPELQLQYEAMMPTIPDTVEGHWDMAERCGKANLEAQREVHLRRVLELSPDHSQARHALGYSQVDGKWVMPEEWRKNQGYVRYRGSWRLPQEIELEKEQEQREEEEVAWRRRLERWRTAIVRGRDNRAEALAQLRAVDSPYAIAPLASMLDDEDEPEPLKLVYVEILSRFDSSRAAAALIDRVMTDPDAEVRERSIAALQKHGTKQAVAVLSSALQSKDNGVVNRAGWALGRLGDPAAIPALIDAVTTTHKIKVYPGGGPGSINTSMGSGGSGLSMGGRPKVIEQTARNRHVLSALTSLTPEGVNFSYNERAWRNWWAQQHVVPGVNLRRNL